LKDILGAIQDASANMHEELDSMKGAIFMNTTAMATNTANVAMLRQQQFATHVAVGKNTASVTRLTKENTVLHQKLATLVKQLEGIQQQYGQTMAQQQMMQQQYGQTMAQQRMIQQRQQLIQEILDNQPSPGYYYPKNCTVNATLREPNPDPKSLREAWTVYY
jgi:predicted ATPase